MIGTFVDSICIDNSRNTCQVRGRVGSKSDYDESKSDVQSGIKAAEHAGCKPIQLQLISRHGARGPTKGDWKTPEDKPGKADISSLLTKLKIERVKTEVGDRFLEFEKMEGILELLSDRGKYELSALGKRLVSVFPELMDNGTWDEQTMKLESSFKNRSKDSAANFAKGAFDRTMEPHVEDPENKKTDKYMRAFDACKTRVDLVKEHRETNFVNSWKDGKRMTQLLAQVNAKGKRMWPLLNSQSWQELNVGELIVLWKACGFQMLSEPQFVRPVPQNVVPKTSKLCSVLDGTDIAALEYSVDLTKYYEFGYGTGTSLGRINTEHIPRPLLQKIQDEWKNPAHKGSFRFGHAETTIPILASLGLFNDSFVLRPDSDPELIDNRKWNMSYAAPMASNLLFVLHDCGAHGHNIQLYVNEELTSMPFCDTNKASLCAAAKFAEKFPEYTENHWGQACDVSIGVAE